MAGAVKAKMVRVTGKICMAYVTTSPPSSAISDNQSDFLRTLAICHGQAGERQHEQQENESVRGQRVPAPSFYKLQLIGHCCLACSVTLTPRLGPCHPHSPITCGAEMGCRHRADTM